jgi:hypothetical protein
VCFDDVKTLSGTVTEYGSENGISVKEIVGNFQSGNGTFTPNGDSFTVTFTEPGICSVTASFEGGNESEATPSDITGTATAVKVEITEYSEKMLIEGAFDIEAKATPEISGEKYDWAFEGAGGGDFDPNPSDDGKTNFKAKKLTVPHSKSSLKVKYSKDEDEKEAQITRCEYFKHYSQHLGFGTIETTPHLFICESKVISPDNNPYDNIPEDLVAVFYGEFVYDLYDQYRNPLSQSETGESIPYVKEEFKSGFQSVFNFPKPMQITNYWAEEEDCCLDHDKISCAVQFSWLKDEKVAKDFHTAIYFRLMWKASVQEGMHSKDTVEHLLESKFFDVERDRKTGQLVSFRLKTEYIRVGALLL